MGCMIDASFKASADFSFRLITFCKQGSKWCGPSDQLPSKWSLKYPSTIPNVWNIIRANLILKPVLGPSNFRAHNGPWNILAYFTPVCKDFNYPSPTALQKLPFNFCPHSTWIHKQMSELFQGTKGLQSICLC